MGQSQSGRRRQAERISEAMRIAFQNANMRNPISQIKKALIEYHVGMKRSDEWPDVRKKHLEEQPWCKMCGSQKNLQVHHITPFHDNPNLELDDSNLITLCETIGVECHLKHGHLGNWKNFNPDIVKQATSPEANRPSPFLIQ